MSEHSDGQCAECGANHRVSHNRNAFGWIRRVLVEAEHRLNAQLQVKLLVLENAAEQRRKLLIEIN